MQEERERRGRGGSLRFSYVIGLPMQWHLPMLPPRQKKCISSSSVALLHFYPCVHTSWQSHYLPSFSCFQLQHTENGGVHVSGMHVIYVRRNMDDRLEGSVLTQISLCSICPCCADSML